VTRTFADDLGQLECITPESFNVLQDLADVHEGNFLQLVHPIQHYFEELFILVGRCNFADYVFLAATELL